jgi:rod shape-determining protein MreC
VSIDLAAKAKESRTLFVLIPLLIMHLGLLSFQIEDSAGTLLLKRWIVAAGTPFLNLSDTVAERSARLWKGYVWLRGARQENQQLRELVQQLALRDSIAAQLREENLRLRRLLKVSDGMSFDNIGARIVSRTPNYLSQVVYINRGASEGVRLDSPVICERGALGRTVLISQHHAQVQLISNPDSSIGVMLEGSRIPGVLRGLGEQRLSLHYISNSEAVNVGDRVMTSGLDGIFPKGIPVGKVVESRKGNKSVFRDIEVEPFADLVRTEEVLILLSKPTTE